MARALERGIFSFNVESIQELQTLSAVATELGTRAPVALRFNPDVDAKTHPYISTGLKKNKFGLRRSEVLAVARALGDFPGIDLNGLSIHIGSQLLSLKPLKDAFERARELMSALDEILPRPLSVLDLGGGLGISYKGEKAPSIPQYTQLIQKMFGGRAAGRRPLKILIEPGRMISGNAGVLLTEVLYRKDRGAKSFVVVDAAMNDLIRPALYGSHHEIAVVERARERGPQRAVDVVGPVCESADCFASGRKLPSGVARGDLLALLSSGAYGFSMASNYNTRPKPPEVLVEGGQFRIIRDRETYDDLLKGEHL
jgi:diaminopimelate decarboxylase